MAGSCIDIISVASDVGSIHAGKSKASAAFHQAGLRKILESVGYTITEYEAFSEGPAEWIASSRSPNGARNEARTVAYCEQVSRTVSAALDVQTPSFQILLSGECLYTPAIMSAYWRHVEGAGRKIGIIYFDADCDLYTPNEGTGTIAGMTLTHLTLRDGALSSMAKFSRPNGCSVVDSSNIVLFGLNVESEVNKRSHLGYLFDNNFRIFTSKTVQRDPVHSAEKAMRWIEEQGIDYVLIHLDVDVIDPGEFPLCNVPNWTGIGYEEAMQALNVFLDSERCVGLSVAEVNPDHDPDLKMTTRLVSDIVKGLGQSKVSGLPEAKKASV
jgi:arginase family enzyme